MALPNGAHSRKEERPDIYRYHDYRIFLKDWLAYQTVSQSGFSLRGLAKTAGLASGYLPMVLSGARSLSAKALSKLGPHLGLGQAERTYLDVLFTLGSSDSQAARLEALGRMKRFRAFRRQNPGEVDAYDYLTRWFYVAIREMASLPDFQLDPEWIRKRLRFKIDSKDIRNALEFLIDRGHLEVLPGGRVRPPGKSLDCSGGVFRVVLTQFHQEMLALASKSIELTPSDERNILGHTVSLDQEGFHKARQILEEALTKVQALGAGEKNGEDVYHMELALFPLTKRKKDEE